MILSRLKHENLQNYIAKLHKQNADEAHQFVLDFLQEVFDCYQSAVISPDTRKKMNMAQSSHWNVYQQIKFKIGLLKKFEKEDADGLATAFDKVYLKYLGDMASSQHLESNESGVGLAEFSNAISKKFTFGLFENLNHLYTEAEVKFAKTADSECSFGDIEAEMKFDDVCSASMLGGIKNAIKCAETGDYYKFIETALDSIIRLESEANKLRSSFNNINNLNQIGEDYPANHKKLLILAEGFESLATAFRLTVNQAIDILINSDEFLGEIKLETQEKEDPVGDNKEEGKGKEKTNKKMVKEEKEKGKGEEKKEKKKEKKKEENNADEINPVESDLAEETSTNGNDLCDKEIANYIATVNKKLIAKVNEAFLKHINFQYAKLISKPDESRENQETLSAIYAYCEDYVKDSKNDIKKRQLANQIKTEILKYYTPDAINPYLVNPCFSLSREELDSDKQYQDLLDHVSLNFHTGLSAVVNNAKKRLSEYVNNRGGFFNFIRDTFYTIDPNDKKSKRKFHADNLSAAFDGFADNPAINDVSSLGAMIYSCNQSMYLPAEKEIQPVFDMGDYRFNRNYIVESYRIKQRSSKLKQAIYSCINGKDGIREFVNKNASQIDFMLSKESGITKHEFYFQLNFSRNKKINEKSKEKYSSKVNSWWGKTLGVITFSKSSTKTNRKLSLTNLRNNLTNCRTEEDYVAFLYSALDVIVKATGRFADKHTFDDLFVDTILDMCREVLSTHIITNDRFRLNFSTEQLQLVEKILRAFKLREDPLYKNLQNLITDRMLEDKRRPNEATIHRTFEEGILQHQEQVNKTQEEMIKDRKVELFRATLLSKLESNLLADIVIGSGRFVLKDRDIGLIGQGLSLVCANAQLPGAAALAAALRTGSHMVDDQLQINQGMAVSQASASHGAFSIYWNDVVAAAVNKIVAIFADEIGRMRYEEDVVRFAEFCFSRIYYALLNHQSNLSKNVDVDYIIASIFRGNKKIGWGRKDHYHRMDDNSWFMPSTTFQGLVTNVGLRCPNGNTTPGMSTEDIYVTMESLEVYGSKGKERSKLAKYGTLPVDDASLARMLTRNQLHTDTKKLDKKPVVKQLDSQIHMMFGKKVQQPQSQNDMVVQQLQVTNS